MQLLGPYAQLIRIQTVIILHSKNSLLDSASRGNSEEKETKPGSGWTFDRALKDDSPSVTYSKQVKREEQAVPPLVLEAYQLEPEP